MSDGEVVLDPVVADRGGHGLTAAGSTLSSLRSGFAHAGASPWGADEVGAAFERGYRPAEEALLAAWSDLGLVVADLGSAVVEAVASTLDADAAAARRTDVI